jgi:hypothetical protein
MRFFSGLLDVISVSGADSDSSGLHAIELNLLGQRVHEISFIDN